jgi:hypothetical protein
MDSYVLSYGTEHTKDNLCWLSNRLEEGQSVTVKRMGTSIYGEPYFGISCEPQSLEIKLMFHGPLRDDGTRVNSQVLEECNRLNLFDGV